ncbi:MAG: PEP-CTERM sorting domain-containing protein [Pirellulales bacterium]
MHRTSTVVLGVLSVVFGLAQAATAGPLPTDPNALPAWQGSVTFDGTTPVATNLTVEVEFAVYAPGQFSTSAALGSPVLPAGAADHYVYAYQVFNTLDGDLAFGSLSVGFQDLVDFVDDLENPANASFLSGFGADPSDASLIAPSGVPTSVVWDFDPLLAPGDSVDGENSTVLYYTSLFPPEFDRATVIGSLGTFDIQQLPSPTPEPGSLVLALAGVAMLSLYRGLRRRN